MNVLDEVTKQAPTAAEVAEKLLGAIQGAAEKVGSETARVWPGMVESRWAEAVWALGGNLVALVLLVVATVWSARFAARVVAKHGNSNAPDDEAACVCSLLLAVVVGVAALITLILLFTSRGSDFAVLVAPEGAYVRELVGQALGKK